MSKIFIITIVLVLIMSIGLVSAGRAITDGTENAWENTTAGYGNIVEDGGYVWTGICGDTFEDGDDDWDIYGSKQPLIIDNTTAIGTYSFKETAETIKSESFNVTGLFNFSNPHNISIKVYEDFHGSYEQVYYLLLSGLSKSLYIGSSTHSGAFGVSYLNYTYNNDGAEGASSALKLDAQWSELIYSYDGNTYNAYGNGQLITTSTVSASGLAKVAIGELWFPLGTVRYDDFRIYEPDVLTSYRYRNYSSLLSADEYVASVNVTIIKYSDTSVNIESSPDNTTWSIVQLDAENSTSYSVTGNAKYIRVNLTSDNGLNSTKLIEINALLETSVTSPTFTYTSANTTSYENEVDIFTANSSQTVNVSWLTNGVELQTNTSVTSFSYSNSTALNGTAHNITAIISNVNGSAQYSWSQLKLLNGLDIFISDNETQTFVHFETSNYTAGLQGFNFTWENRIGTTGNTSTLYYQNGTSITSNSTYVNGNVTLIPGFLIPAGTCYINETLDESTMTIPANSWGMFNNWTGNITFAGIAANESNDICYTYYNVTNGLWESYYVGYSWNGNYQLSKDASVIGYFDAQTDITSNIITPSSTELYTGWNMLGVQSSSNQTISGIIADIGTDCSDSWYFNSSTSSYLNTTTHSIQPNQGFLAYITQNMTWTRSAI